MSGYSLSRARRLLQAKHRRGSGLFLGEGPHLLDDALAAASRGGRPPLQVFVRSGTLGAGADAALDRARSAGVPVREVDERELASLADTRTPQGIVAVLHVPDAPAAPFSGLGLWLLLDGVGDPGNAGTLLRAADAFGVSGVVALPGTVDLWAAKTVRAGQGAHLRLVVLQDDGPARLAEFRAAGGAVWAAERAGVSVYEAPPRPPRLMLALGNEAHGLSSAAADVASLRVCVPQRGPADSLNVAMAGAVLLSWLSRDRA